MVLGGAVAAVCLGMAYLLVEKGALATAAPLGALACIALLAALLRRPGASVVAVVALLTVYPVGRVVAGPVPVYFGDILIVVAVIALLASGWRSPPARVWLGVYLISWVPALVYQWFTLGSVLDSVYGFGRNALAVSVFLIGAWLGTHPDEGRRAGVTLCLGSALTAVITLGQAIPATSGLVRKLLESLSPTFAAHGYQRYPNRAFAFFEAPTALAGFLAVMAVFAAGLAIVYPGRVRRLALVTVIVIAPALIATYSRQWVPALAVGVLMLVALRPRVLAPGVVVVLIAASIVVGALVAGSLNATYLSGRFSGAGTARQNISDRLAQPGRFLAAQATGGPETIVGRGFATSDILDRTTLSSDEVARLSEGLPKENSILLEIYNHGIAAGILLVGFLVGAMALGAGLSRNERLAAMPAIGLSAAVASCVVLAWSDQYFSEALFMKAILWLFIGWVFGLRAFAAEVLEGNDETGRGQAQGRPPR